MADKISDVTAAVYKALYVEKHELIGIPHEHVAIEDKDAEIETGFGENDQESDDKDSVFDNQPDDVKVDDEMDPAKETPRTTPSAAALKPAAGAAKKANLAAADTSKPPASAKEPAAPKTAVTPPASTIAAAPKQPAEAPKTGLPTAPKASAPKATAPTVPAPKAGGNPNESPDENDPNKKKKAPPFAFGKSEAEPELEEKGGSSEGAKKGWEVRRGAEHAHNAGMHLNDMAKSGPWKMSTTAAYKKLKVHHDALMANPHLAQEHKDALSKAHEDLQFARNIPFRGSQAMSPGERDHWRGAIAGYSTALGNARNALWKMSKSAAAFGAENLPEANTMAETLKRLVAPGSLYSSNWHGRPESAARAVEILGNSAVRAQVSSSPYTGLAIVEIHPEDLEKALDAAKDTETHRWVWPQTAKAFTNPLVTEGDMWADWDGARDDDEDDESDPGVEPDDDNIIEVGTPVDMVSGMARGAVGQVMEPMLPLNYVQQTKGIFSRDPEEKAGTSEGAKKGAETKKMHGGQSSKTQKPYTGSYYSGDGGVKPGVFRNRLESLGYKKVDESHNADLGKTVYKYRHPEGHTATIDVENDGRGASYVGLKMHAPDAHHAHVAKKKDIESGVIDIDKSIVADEIDILTEIVSELSEKSGTSEGARQGWLARMGMSRKQVQGRAKLAHFGIDKEWDNNWHGDVNEAHSAAGILRAHGVRAKFVRSHYEGLGKVHIHQDDLAKAREIAKQYGDHVKQFIKKQG